MLSSNPPSPTRNPESTGKYDGSHCLADSSVDNIRSNSDAAYKLDKYQIQTQPPPLAPSPLRQTATAASKQLYHERTSSTSGSVRSVFSSSTSVISAGLLLPASFDPASTASLANGVIYEYYRGEFESLPDFNQIPHLRRKIGVTAGINIDSFSEISHFGLEDSVAENNDFVGESKLKSLPPSLYSPQPIHQRVISLLGTLV